jgi:hypothetical protein
VFDTKQPLYRILFQREPNSTCLQIAVAETENALETVWHWIQQNMIPELQDMEDPYAKEEWVNEKIHMIVTTIGKLPNKAQPLSTSLNLSYLFHTVDSGTDELSSDQSVRNASRSFRQIFDVPPSERLVSCKYQSHRWPHPLIHSTA